MKDNNYYMQLALDLAKKGIYGIGANPMVGCVIVRNDEVVASGYHQKFGENHAEINALEKIDFNAQNCDIYITLEPCSHFGNTPPCVDSVIKSNPKKVIIASLDSNPKVDSVEKMKNAGIEVIFGILSEKEQILNRGFHKRMKAGLPFVSCKIACSLDGKIALKNGESKWITGELARADVQKMRAINQALISGSTTVLMDNPHFNVRDKNKPSPLKVIMDRSGKITDKSLNIFNGSEVIISDELPLEILKLLGKKGVNNALIEAGGKINNAFLQMGLIDELIIYQAPIIMGEDAKNSFAAIVDTMSDKIIWRLISVEKIGDDIKMVYQK